MVRHSVEESEHKAVAFDLYQHLYGNGLSAYIPRVSVYTFSLILITSFSTIYQLVLMKRDKQLTNFKSWRNFFGFASKQYKVFIPKFLEYYRFDFHPNQTDEKALVAATKIKLRITDASLLMS
jgi:predicted metal-dependent hydrolase